MALEYVLHVAALSYGMLNKNSVINALIVCFMTQV